ncbi:MAG: hypothetical protein JXA72_06390 [Bacteroidales bacterium]|nr:hypothetical protein [Bacteroidales bacterium]
MKNQLIPYLSQVLLLATGLVFFACGEEQECTESIVPKSTIGFYTLSENKITSAVIKDLSVYGLARDSMLYDTVDKSAITLPLSQTQDNCLFVMKIGTEYDTLRFNYTRDLDFVSKECGFTMRCTIYKFEFTTHLIDSAQIIYPYVHTTETENIRLFF